MKYCIRGQKTYVWVSITNDRLMLFVSQIILISRFVYSTYGVVRKTNKFLE